MASPVEDRSIEGSVAVAQSDSLDVPEGRYLAIICTVAGNVKISLIDGSTFTFPVVTGLTVLPYKVKRVWSTGTTATATFANQG